MNVPFYNTYTRIFSSMVDYREMMKVVKNEDNEDLKIQ